MSGDCSGSAKALSGRTGTRLDDDSFRAAVRRFVASDDPDDVYAAVVTHAEQALDCDACRIATSTGDGSALQPRASSTDEPARTDHLRGLARTVADHAYRTGTGVVINDLTFAGSTRSEPAPGSAADAEQSLLTAPIEEYGVFQALDSAPDSFSRTDLEWVEELLVFAGDALDRLHSTAPPGRDPTAERRAERERVRAAVAAIAHDVRNPLSIARGYVELLREAGPESDEAEAHLDHVETAVERIDQLVEDVRLVTESGELVPEREPLSLEAVADAAWESVPTEDAGLVVEDSLSFRGDGSQVQRVLENLFRNAVEHGSTSPASNRQDADGASSVEPSAADATEDAVEHGGPDVTVRVGPLDDGRGFYVADDGPGIPEPHRDAVFEPGEARRGDGAGLGLAIVERIADAHGWEVTVTESAAGGARFEFHGVEATDR